MRKARMSVLHLSGMARETYLQQVLMMAKQQVLMITSGCDWSLSAEVGSEDSAELLYLANMLSMQ